jgi:hypothetical protein
LKSANHIFWTRENAEVPAFVRQTFSGPLDMLPIGSVLGLSSMFVEEDSAKNLGPSLSVGGFFVKKGDML